MTVSRRDLVVAFSALMASPAMGGDAAVRVGHLAPAFEARDVDGKMIALSQFKGRTVVLEWTNPECPWVAKHYVSSNLQSLQADAASKGVVWLTVSSAAPGNPGYLDALEAAALVDQRQAKAAHFLLDRDGRMLRDYAVSVALTLAVIAPDGRLAYYGAIDDQPNARAEDVAKARNYVRAALAAVANGEMPSPAQTRPYGCSPR